MYYENDKVFIEDEDQCITCQNYLEGVACPLLNALGQKAVYLEDNLIVTNCGFFRRFKRRLRIVRRNDNNNSD